MENQKHEQPKGSVKVVRVKDSQRTFLGDLNNLAKFSKSLGEKKGLESLFTKVLDSFIKVFRLSSGALFVEDEISHEFSLVINNGLKSEFMQAMRQRLNRLIEDRLACDKERYRFLKHTLDHSIVANCDELVFQSYVDSLISIPLESADKIIGVVILTVGNNNIPSKEEKLFLNIMGSQAGVAIENALLLQKMSQLSVLDELTKMYNRRHFYEVLEIEIERAKRHQRTLSLAILDIDKFKEFNDKFGHDGGDNILRSLGGTMYSNLRKTDICFRFGGDEFAVIMSETDSLKAKEVMERVRLKWLHMPKIKSFALENPVGFSAGIAEFPKDTEKQDSLLSLADAALYFSKKTGGYKSTLASEMKNATPQILANELTNV